MLHVRPLDDTARAWSEAQGHLDRLTRLYPTRRACISSRSGRTSGWPRCACSRGSPRGPARARGRDRTPGGPRPAPAGRALGAAGAAWMHAVRASALLDLDDQAGAKKSSTEPPRSPIASRRPSLATPAPSSSGDGCMRRGPPSCGRRVTPRAPSKEVARARGNEPPMSVRPPGTWAGEQHRLGGVASGAGPRGAGAQEEPSPWGKGRRSA